MVIGGYSLEKLFDSITVKHYESGWSFFIQGDDAQTFLDEWQKWQDAGYSNFSHFLSTHEYDTLFQ